MSIYNSGNNDSNKAINLYNDLKKNTQDLVISESLYKTVGVGKDFETLHEAMLWVQSLVFKGSGWAYFTLDDGVHVLGSEESWDENWWSHYTITNLSMTLTSASGNKADCVITLSDWDDFDNYPTVFYATNCWIAFNHLTIDLALGGYPYDVANTNFLLTERGTSFVSYGVTFNSGNYYAGENSFMDITNAIFNGEGTDIDNRGGLIKLKNSVFNDNTTTPALTIDVGGRVIMENPVFNNITTISNVPLNEIQYDGSYISDGTSALSFKA